MPIEPGSFSFGFVAGGAVVGVINHYLAKSRDTESRSIKEFNEAATKFRDAFKDEFLALNPTLSKCTIDPAVLLKSSLSKHGTAIFDFKPFLGKDADRLEQTWQKYYRHDEFPEIDREGLAKYAGNHCTYEEAYRRRLCAIQNIECILSFANHK